MCVFPKWCEQTALCVGFRLANVSNWPRETVQPQMLCCFIHNGPFTCFCIYMCVPGTMRMCVWSSWSLYNFASVCVFDDSEPVGWLLYVLILICAWAVAHCIPAPWSTVSKGHHYHPVLTVSEPGGSKTGTLTTMVGSNSQGNTAQTTWYCTICLDDIHLSAVLFCVKCTP